MLSELELYKLLDSMFPASMDRQIPEMACEAAEYDSAIADLITGAYMEGYLTKYILDLVFANTPNTSELYPYLLTFKSKPLK